MRHAWLEIKRFLKKDKPKELNKNSPCPAKGRG
jgi:hypothetical protein